MTEESREAVAERLRRRYPRPRLPRPVLVVIVALGVVVAGLWLVPTAWQQSHPPAAAEVTEFQFESDTKINITFRVDRSDPSIPVSCRLVAQASDLQVVGEQIVVVPPGDVRQIELNMTLITLRRAVSAEVRGCRAA